MTITNCYKRRDVFRCRMGAHADFGGRVSVYHVLKEKRCYPEGCLYFLWHCTRLLKGRSCIRGFQWTGRLCFGCTHFVEEKMHFQPERLLSDEDYRTFLESLEEYEAWLERIRLKRLAIFGRIRMVKPWYERTIDSFGTHTRLRGYLLTIQNGFIGQDRFLDTLYIRVPESLMIGYRFVPKMKIELEAEIREDRGRLVGTHPRKIEVFTRGWGRPWTRSRALVSMKTAKTLQSADERCSDCPYGSLVDVVNREEGKSRRARDFVCLAGCDDPRVCSRRSLPKPKQTIAKRDRS